MFIITLTYRASLDHIDQFLVEHRQWLDQHYASGLFLASGPQNPRTGGIILARGGDRQALVDLLKNDPFQREGLADYQITEFQAVKYQPGFEAFV